MTLEIELESLKNETDVWSVERREDVEKLLGKKKAESRRLDELVGDSLLSAVFDADVSRLERARLRDIKETKPKLEEAKHELDVAQREGRFDTASRLRYSVIPELEAKLPKDDAPASSTSRIGEHHEGNNTVSATRLDLNVVLKYLHVAVLLLDELEKAHIR
jgi:ATP-dependent Clp protease ATP-binding subunit ClpB